MRATSDNAARVYEALTAFGAPLEELAVSDLASDGLIYQIGVPPNRIDILTSVTGVSFDEAWPDRQETEYGDQTICLISRAHLSDGPVDFLARLTALIPVPRFNKVCYYGAFSPASPLRAGFFLGGSSIPPNPASHMTILAEVSLLLLQRLPG